MQNDAVTQDDALFNLFSMHADALNKGEQSAAQLVQEYRSSLPSDALALLALARELKQLLVPRNAPQSFKRDLRRQLISTSEVTLAGMRLPGLARRVGTHAAGNRPLLVGAAAVGSLLPVLGLLLFWRKRQRTEPLSSLPEPAA